MSPTIRRTTRTGRGFIEPLLEVGNALPLHMVLVPSGTFIMGSPEEEEDREEREGPQHQVAVPSFFMGRYPVTQAQYEQVMETNPATQYDTDHFVAPDKPVVGVNWHRAVEFCQRLAQLTERPYRLPSEAEWEYACRAGTKTPFYFGKTLTTEVANYDGNDTYANGPKGEYRNETTPVIHFGIANAFGLSDMHGNVYEWCQDYGHNDYDNAPTDGSAWTEGVASTRRVIRGGSWLNFPRNCRSAYRYWYEPDPFNCYVGFRVVCSAPRTL
ncbi:MAG: formylglycine-generating enzyme family protein [Cyanobacteria bacterium J06626_18]